MGQLQWLILLFLGQVNFISLRTNEPLPLDQHSAGCRWAVGFLRARYSSHVLVLDRVKMHEDSIIQNWHQFVCADGQGSLQSIVLVAEFTAPL